MFTAHDVYSAQLDAISNEPSLHIKKKSVTHIPKKSGHYVK